MQNPANDGYNAVQLGFNDQKEQRLTRAGSGTSNIMALPSEHQEFRSFGKEAGRHLGAALSLRRLH
jgi:hypothetical protein